MNQITPVVKNLIIINVIVFFAISNLFPGWQEYFLAYFPLSPNFKPIQIVTHMFMHGSISHIFMNMFMLYMFGSVLEYFWGGKYFLFVYLVSGLGAILFHFLVKYIYLHYFIDSIPQEAFDMLVNEGKYYPKDDPTYMATINKIGQLINTPAVGASGATMGILAGFGTQFPRRKLMLLFPPIPVEARILIPLLIVVELFMGLGVDDNIAHFAHIGGAITGFLLTYFRHKINI